MIDLTMYGPGEAITGPNLITFEGTGRSGKGTADVAVADALRTDGRSVLLIDQGQKFRTLGFHALELGLDLGDEVAARSFLEADRTRTGMLGLLGRISVMSDGDVHSLLYPTRVGDAAKELAKHRASHELAVGILFDQVNEAGQSNVNTVLVDGRALEGYGRQMHDEKMRLYPLGFYFQSDALTSARWVRKEFHALKDMTTEDKLALLAEAENIRMRNDDDAKRDVDRMRYPDHAFNLDLLRGLPADKEERAEELEQVIETGLVGVQTSHATIEQMLPPVIEITRTVLQDTDSRRKSWNTLSNAHRWVFERVPEPAALQS